MNPAILRNILLFVLISAVAFGCGDSATDPDPESDPVTIQGRVVDEDPNDGDSMEGWIVTANEVQSDGSLQPIGDVEAQTGADGEFTLVIDGEDVANTSDDIILRATRDNEVQKTFLTADLESGTTVYAKPIDTETTGEANLYEQVVINGDDDMVTQADIDSHIGPVSSDEFSDEGTATSISSALATSAATMEQSFESQEVDFTDDMRTDVDNAEREAQVQLEADLYNNPDQREQAYATYNEALADGWTDAGVSESPYARSRHLSGLMLSKNTLELSAESNDEIRANNAEAVAIGIDRAVQARLEGLNASETGIQEAADAGTTLRSEVRADGSISEAEAESAFETYNNAIVTVLQDEFPENAQAIAETDAEINAPGGARAELDSEVEAVNDSQLVVDAYTAYDEDVQSIANARLMGATAEETEAIADMMVLINSAN